MLMITLISVGDHEFEIFFLYACIHAPALFFFFLFMFLFFVCMFFSSLILFCFCFVLHICI